MRAALRAEPHQTFLRDAVWARAAIVAAAKARTCQRATTKAAMTEFRRAVDAVWSKCKASCSTSWTSARVGKVGDLSGF